MAASCTPPTPQQSPWGVAALAGSVLGALIYFRRPEIADGCDISCLLIWQEIIFIPPEGNGLSFFFF